MTPQEPASDPLARATLTIADAIQRQKAIRTFTAEPVSRADLDALLEAAYRCGSERNRQRWAIVSITNPDLLQRLATFGNHTDPLRDASLALALVQQPEGYEFDTGRIAQRIMLTATALELGSCPVTLHHDGQARALLGLDDTQRCRYIIALGHPATGARPARMGQRARRDQLIHHERYSP